LGLVKNLVKALNKESTALTYLISFFQALSYAKIEEGIFAGPEIKKLLKDNKFTTLLSSKEAAVEVEKHRCLRNIANIDVWQGIIDVFPSLLRGAKQSRINLSLSSSRLDSGKDLQRMKHALYPEFPPL